MYSATTVVVVVVADATATAAVVPCQIGCVCFPISLLLLLPRITLPTETAVAHIHVQPTVKLILSSFPVDSLLPHPTYRNDLCGVVRVCVKSIKPPLLEEGEGTIGKFTTFFILKLVLDAV